MNSNDRYSIELSWPPSMNSYWLRSKHGMYLSKRGRDYKLESETKIMGKSGFYFGKARLSFCVKAYQPDKRKRDLDNILKPLIDVFNKIVFDDDSQIDYISIERKHDGSKKGVVLVTITELTKDQEATKNGRRK